MTIFAKLFKTKNTLADQQITEGSTPSVTSLSKLSNLKDLIVEKTNRLNEFFAQYSIRSNHKLRIRFYELVKGYINSPGSESPSEFFEWYPKQLDMRLENKPQWLRLFFKMKKVKNDQNFRTFLERCALSLESDPSFINALKGWVPDDEYQMLSSTASSNITPVLDIAIDMAQDKEDSRTLVMGIVLSNVPLMLIGLAFHLAIFNFVYKQLVRPGFQDIKTWEEMNGMEQNYIYYEWLANPIHLACVLASIFAFVSWISWLNKNWRKKGRFLRVHYFDCIPPFSLSKITNQYNVIMIISNFMKSGKSFGEALEKARDESSPYVQSHIEEIMQNSASRANEAINIFYLGDYGSDIRERAEHIPLDSAIHSLIPRMRQSRKDRIQKVYSLTMKIFLKPIIILSFAASAGPLFINIMSSMPQV